MICPRCNTQLLSSTNQGVEIDYCPQCKGVWLDRGELDKIIFRSCSHHSSDHEDRYDSDNHKENDHDGSFHKSHYENDHHPRQKRGFLSELFDF